MRLVLCGYTMSDWKTLIDQAMMQEGANTIEAHRTYGSAVRAALSNAQLLLTDLEAANYLNYTPMLIAENAANRHAQKYMQETGQPVDKSIPREQLRNYGVGIGVDAIGQVGAGVLIKGLAENPHTRDFTRAILHLDEVEKGAKVAKDVSKEAFNYLKHKARDLW